jgi:hypothetical protein
LASKLQITKKPLDSEENNRSSSETISLQRNAIVYSDARAPIMHANPRIVDWIHARSDAVAIPETNSRTPQTQQKRKEKVKQEKYKGNHRHA